MGISVESEALSRLAKARVVIYGPQCSGKTTLCKWLVSQNPKIDYVSLRDKTSKFNEGSLVREYLRTLDNWPPELGFAFLGVDILTAANRSLRGGSGFILDGYPRTEVEAHHLTGVLSRARAPIDAVVQLDVGHDVVWERIIRERVEGGRKQDLGATQRRYETYQEQASRAIAVLASVSKGCEVFKLDTTHMGVNDVRVDFLNWVATARLKSDLLPIKEKSILASYEDVEKDIETLVQQLKRDGCDKVVTIALGRGGWYMSRRFDEKARQEGVIVCPYSVVTEYVNDNTPESYPRVKQGLDDESLRQVLVLQKAGYKAFVCDSVYTSGRSLETVREYLNRLGIHEVKTMVMHWNVYQADDCNPRLAGSRPDYYSRVIDSGVEAVYVEYPWEAGNLELFTHKMLQHPEHTLESNSRKQVL